MTLLYSLKRKLLGLIQYIYTVSFRMFTGSVTGTYGKGTYSLLRYSSKKVTTLPNRKRRMLGTNVGPLIRQ